MLGHFEGCLSGGPDIDYAGRLQTAELYKSLSHGSYMHPTRHGFGDKHMGVGTTLVGGSIH